MNTQTYQTDRPAIVIRRTINPGQKADKFATPAWAKRMGKFDVKVLTSQKETVEDWVWELTYGEKNEPYVFASSDYLEKQLGKVGARVIAVLNEDKLPQGVSVETKGRLHSLINTAKMMSQGYVIEQQALEMKKQAEEMLNEAKLREQEAIAREARANEKGTLREDGKASRSKRESAMVRKDS